MFKFYSLLRRTALLISLVLICCMAMQQTAQAQCFTAGYGLYPSTTFTPTCTGAAQDINTCCYAGEYSNVNVVSGNSYTFSSSAGYYITISNSTGTVAYAFGNNPVTWAANITGVVRFYTHTNSACGELSGCTTRSVACSVLPAGCLTASYGLYPSATFTPTCTGIAQAINTCCYAGEYSNVSVTSGTSYTFSSSAGYYITIGNTAGTVVLASGNSPLTWVANTTSTIRFYTHTNSACGESGATCTTRSVACTAPLPGCLTAGYGLYPSATFTPTCTGTAQDINTCCYAGEYSNVNVTSGNSYTFSSSAGYYITIGNTAGTVVLASGNSPLTWVANTTSTIRFYTHTNSACGELSGCTTRSVACSAAPPAGCLTASYGLYPSATFTPTCTGTAQAINTCCYAGEYSNVNVTSGTSYTFSSSAGYYITIGNAAGTVVLASGNSPLIWVANTTGVVRFYTHTNSACGESGATCTTRSVACTLPSFDVCAGAIPLTCGSTVTGTTVGATLDAVGTCTTTLNTAPGVWYSLTPTLSGPASVSLCGSSYDTKLGVFSGTCGALVCVAGNDDNSLCVGGTLTSLVNFTATAGTTYYILVTGFSTNSGAFTLTNTCPPACSAPTGVTVTGVTATSANVNWTCTGCTGAFVVEYGPSATFTTPGTGATAGAGGTVISLATSPQLISGLTAGTQYRVFVRQDCGGTGFSPNTTGVLFSTLPANDNVCNAIPLGLGVSPAYSNAGATVEPGEPAPPATGCGTQTGWCNSTLSFTVWFTVVGPPSGIITISTTGFDNQIALYSAASCAAVTSGGATLIAANDDFNGLAASINNVCVTPGVTYYVQLDSYSTVTTGSTTFTVTAGTNTPPAITCPANQTISNALNQCGATATWTTPTPVDNCPGATASASVASGSLFPVGVNTVTYTATDVVGATATCSFTITVNDTQAPGVSCPANITVSAPSGSCTANVSFGATASDNCPGASVTTAPLSGTAFNIGNTTVTATATDAANNTSTCSFTVTVNDVDPPVITCPANVVTCANFAFWTPATATDCGSTTISGTAASGDFFPVGITTVTYTATDFSGNTSSCSFTVQVAKISTTFTVSNYSGFGVSCNGGNNGSATAVPVGGSGFSYAWSNGGTGATISGLSAGTYFVTVTNAQGCSLVSSVQITQPAPLSCSAATTNPGCNGDATGSITGSALGGVPPYSYSWSSGSGNPNTGLTAGSYTMTVTDANGCICVKPVTLFEAPELQVVSAEVISDGGGGLFYSIYRVIIAGGTLPYAINFTGSGGFANYQVTYGVVDTDGNGSPDTPGVTIDVTYQATSLWTLTVNDANGCAGAEPFSFTNAPASAILGIAGAAVTPDNGSSTGAIALTVSGGSPCPGYTYAWIGPTTWCCAASSSTGNISGLPAGWYVVTINDCGGGQTVGWYWVPKQTRGRGKLAQGEAITAYPNPVSQQTTIEFSIDQTANTTVDVYAIDGKHIAQLYKGIAEGGELYTLPFDAANLPNGLYMVTLTDEKGMVQQHKLSVMH